MLLHSLSFLTDFQLVDNKIDKINSMNAVFHELHEQTFLFGYVVFQKMLKNRGAG